MKHKITLTLPIVLAIIFLSSMIFGQKGATTPSVYKNDSADRDWNLSISFDPTTKEDFVSIVVLDNATAAKVPYGAVAYFGAKATGQPTGFKLLALPLEPGMDYQLLISSIVRKADGSFDKIETKTFAVSTPKSTTTPVAGPAAKGYKPVKSKSKSDSDFYFSGEVTKVSTAKTAFTTEIKIEPRFGPGTWWYSPFFHLNASTDPDADPDTMDIGFKTTHSIILQEDPKRGTPTSVLLSLGGKVESQKDFKNTNLIFDPNLDFLLQPFWLRRKSRSWSRSHWPLAFDLNAGVEVGKNLKSPFPDAQGAGVARIVGGARMIVDLPFKEGETSGFAFEADWTRRWLLKRELAYKVNDDKTLSLVEFGKSPRDFLEAKLDYNLNDFLSPYIAYDWGQVPPSYKLLDHRVRIGLTLKFKIKR